MKFGVIVFPGSNCDHDVYDVLKRHFNQKAVYLWHKNNSLEDSDVVILPGGFAYGDYLRTGAIARFSPIMNQVIQFAKTGRPVIGICNGFQILLESRLLPGAMLRNKHLQFACKFVSVKVCNSNSMFTSSCEKQQILNIPIAHIEGNYYIDAHLLKELEDNQQILLRYCSQDGAIAENYNPNGSRDNIAGVMNKQGNVFGLMPHPERASEKLLGSDDGKLIFQSIIESLS